MFIEFLWHFSIPGSRQCAGLLVQYHSAMILCKHKMPILGVFFIWIGFIYVFSSFIMWTFIFVSLGGIATTLNDKTLWGGRALFCSARGSVRDLAECLSLRLTSVACRRVFCALSLASYLQYFGGPHLISGVQFLIFGGVAFSFVVIPHTYVEPYGVF